MTSRRPVSIVVLCWNHWRLTERCLDSIRRYTDLSDVEVIVVDNGSTDRTPRALRRHAWIRVVRNPTNLGFARGINVGIAAAPAGSDLVLLNNDVEIRQPGWLDVLRATAHSAADIGIVGCRLVDPDGHLLHAGSYIAPETCLGHQLGGHERDVNQYAHTREVQGVVFACAYIRRETLEAIGPLSLAYDTYLEDTDYCLTARRAGFRTLCCGAVTLIHQQGGSTRDDPGLYARLLQRGSQTFRTRWKAALEAGYRHTLAWQSTLHLPYGYGMSCRGILHALEADGVRVGYSYVYGPGTPVPIGEPDDTGDYILNLIRRREIGAMPEISVVYGQGDVFARNLGRYKIGYTMLEVDGFPREWARQANEMDEVWVPTAFNREGLIASGVRRPIYVMPLGVDVGYFHPNITAVPNPRGDYVFLSVLEWGERKYPELLLKTFNETFRRDEPVLLLCKITNRDPEVDVRRAIRALGPRGSGGRLAFIYNVDVPYYQLGSLYRSANCYVSAGRGEGWDMPLLEAMACGLPTIATDWGGHTEFVHEGISYPLRIRGTVAARARCRYYDGYSWADPDPAHLAELLRTVYEDRRDASERGRRAAEEVAAQWTWRHAATRIRARLDAIRSY